MALRRLPRALGRARHLGLGRVGLVAFASLALLRAPAPDRGEAIDAAPDAASTVA